jgi:group I intron endonuclease
MKITGIYIIKNSIDTRVYIGSAVNFEARKYRHILHLRNQKHHSRKLQRFVNKYGIDVISFEILEECRIDLLMQREQFYIDAFNSCEKGFNELPTAGSWLNKKHRPESLLRIGAASKGRKKTEAMKRNIQAKMKGRVIEWAAKLKKLTVLDCEEIASCYAANYPVKKLASEFGISTETVRQVVNGTYFSEKSPLGPWK